METGTGWIFLGMMADSAVMLIPEILIDIFLVKNKFKKNAVLYIDVLISIYSIFKTLIVIYLIMYSVLAVPVIMLAVLTIILYIMRIMFFTGKINSGINIKIIFMIITTLWGKIVWALPFFPVFLG